eukprot:scaffold1411_cov125-Isochrysis_galbana.AAC.12
MAHWERLATPQEPRARRGALLLCAARPRRMSCRRARARGTLGAVRLGFRARAGRLKSWEG